MTEFEDFKPFFEAMIAKMQTHDHDRGDSWKEDGFYRDINTRYMSEGPHMRFFKMDPWLLDLLKDEVKEYEAKLDPKELLDIANFCGMLYMRSLGRTQQ